MTRRLPPLCSLAEQAALWRDMGAYLSEHPVCPECQRFIPAALWDQHTARHHENRVGLAEEAKAPPPHEED